MMFHITANAILRTWFDAPLPDTLEITQYWYLPIVAFLGFVAAQHRGQHIAADLIFERLPHVVRPYVLALMFALCALVAAGFAWFSFPEAMHSMDIDRTAGVSDLVSWPTPAAPSPAPRTPAAPPAPRPSPPPPLPRAASAPPPSPSRAPPPPPSPPPAAPLRPLPSPPAAPRLLH